MKTRQSKRLRQSKRQSERNEIDDKEDRLSDLSDCVLLHILKFVNTIYAVRTCVLSKRFKNLWKGLTDFSLHSNNFNSLTYFQEFVNRVLIRRCGPFILHSLDFSRHGCIDRAFLWHTVQCAVIHNVKKLTIHVKLNAMVDFELPRCLFSCRSLTFLKITALSLSRAMAKFPKSFELPALNTLHLRNIIFTISYDDCADPFTTCNMLNTLVIDHCTLRRGTGVLRISNSNLSSLTILGTWDPDHKIEFSTPKLSALTIKTDPYIQITACNLPLLDEVCINSHNLNMAGNRYDPFIFILLPLLANDVKIMTLCSRTLEILNLLSTLGSIKNKPPCFGKLKSLTVDTYYYSKLSEEELGSTVAYLLQNSPIPRIEFVNIRK